MEPDAVLPAKAALPSKALPDFARADLERLKLAADIILRLAADDVLPAPLEVELTLLRDHLEHALLLSQSR